MSLIKLGGSVKDGVDFAAIFGFLAGGSSVVVSSAWVEFNEDNALSASGSGLRLGIVMVNWVRLGVVGRYCCC